MERAFPQCSSRGQLSLPYASSGDMSPAISDSVAWLLQTLWNNTGGGRGREGDDVMSLPEVFPWVSVGQVFAPSHSGEAVDHKHAISPDDDLLRSSLTQPKGFNCREEFGSCHRLIPAMQDACSSSQRVKQATVGEDPRDTFTTTTKAGGLWSQCSRSRL